MLSRVADSLYWTARYLERAEHTARIMDVHMNLMLDQSSMSAGERWQRVARCLGLRLPETQVLDAQELLHTIAFQAGNDSSIVACIMDARENARQVREQISSEMWEQINKLFHEVRRANATDILETQPIEFLTGVRHGVHLFDGITDSTMNHGQAWQFIQLGKYLERATATATVLDEHFREFGGSTQSHESGEHLEWIGLLRCFTAFEAYCKVANTDLSPMRIADFLLLDPEFPHSLRFAVDKIQATLNCIGEASPARKAGALHNIAGRMRSSLSFSRIDEILDSGLHTYLAGVQRECNHIHSSMHQVYIAYPIQSALEAS